MVPNLKELSAKERKGASPQVTIIHGGRNRWLKNSAEKGTQQVESQGRSHLRKGQGREAALSTGKWTGKAFRKEVALSSAAVVVFIWSHVSSAGLFRAIPGQAWVEGYPSTTAHFWGFSLSNKGSKQSRQSKNLWSQETKMAQSERLAIGGNMANCQAYPQLRSRDSPSQLPPVVMCEYGTHVAMSFHFFPQEKKKQTNRNPDS